VERKAVFVLHGSLCQIVVGRERKYMRRQMREEYLQSIVQDEMSPDDFPYFCYKYQFCGYDMNPEYCNFQGEGYTVFG
jgi:hypothetical protein